MKKKILSYFCVALLSMSICGGVKADTTKSIELMDWNTGSLDSSAESVTQELPNDPSYYENFCDTFFKENEDQIAGASVAAIKLFQGDTFDAMRPFLIGNIVLGVAIACGNITLMISQYKDKKKSKWMICFAIITAILLGIGIHLGFFSGC